jgi:hypothetical protein
MDPRMTCEDCGEVLDDDTFTHCTTCCPHSGDVEPRLGFLGDGAREDPGSGVCADCGADVHLEHEDDRVYWETD